MGWGVHDYPSPPEVDQPVCPVCGGEAYRVFLRNGEVVGCDLCLLEIDAYEWLQEEKEDMKYRE